MELPKTHQCFEKLHEQQQSIMIISHQERILNIADQIVLVANGSIKQIGTKEEIMPQLMEVAGVCDFYKNRRTPHVR